MQVDSFMLLEWRLEIRVLISTGSGPVPCNNLHTLIQYDTTCGTAFTQKVLPITVKTSHIISNKKHLTEIQLNLITLPLFGNINHNYLVRNVTSCSSNTNFQFIVFAFPRTKSVLHRSNKQSPSKISCRLK